MKIKAAFKDRETGEIFAAEIWAHKIRLPGLDLELAVSPWYGLDKEGKVRRYEKGYRLTELKSGFSVGLNDSLKLLIESVLIRIPYGLEAGIKAEAAKAGPVEQRKTLAVH